MKKGPLFVTLILALGISLLSRDALSYSDEDALDQPRKWLGSDCDVKKTPPAMLRDNVAAVPDLLAKHATWLKTDRRRVSPASFSSKHLDGVDLSGVDLSQANLSDATLVFANLSSATLDGANLANSGLSHGDFRSAKLRKAGLAGADLSCAWLSHADLEGANLSCFSDNTGTRCVSLNNAALIGTKLKDADLEGASLKGAIFEPISLPNLRPLASAGDLELLTYEKNPDALFQLRKQFQDAGFVSQERKITYALNRRQAELDGGFGQWFKTVAFDWTTQYGMNPGRSIKIWLSLFSICCAIYWMFIVGSKRPVIYLIDKDSGARSQIHREKIHPTFDDPRSRVRYISQLMIREMRLVFWAITFSLTSAFNIGFHEVDLGRWLRLLSRTECEMRAEGWIRTIAGLQSVFSLYLMALWILTYFGRPFA